MTHLSVPNYPFVEAYHKGDKQKPTAVVIRASSTPSTDGAALGVAHMLHRASSPLNPAHYVIDEAHIYRCINDKIASKTEDNSTNGAIFITICAEAVPESSMWEETSRLLVLDKTAELVAHLLLVYKIPRVYLDGHAMRRWKKRKSRNRGGIRIDLQGAWPWADFQTEVAKRMDNIKSSKS